MEDFIHLTEEELKDFDKKKLIEYINHQQEVIGQLKIYADKNCSECQKYWIKVDDLNVGLLMEDWRDCSHDCENCNIDRQVQMCQIQHDLFNFLANQVSSLNYKFEGLVKFLLKKEPGGEKLLDAVKKQGGKEKKMAQELADSLYK